MRHGNSNQQVQYKVGYMNASRHANTLSYVDYVMSKIAMLQHHGVIPLMVLDGGFLPAKAPTEEDRLR